MAVSGILSGSCPRAAARTACLALCLLALAGTAAAQDPNECDEPGDYPDLTLGELESVVLWGPVDGISAYSIGAATCCTDVLRPGRQDEVRADFGSFGQVSVRFTPDSGWPD